MNILFYTILPEIVLLSIISLHLVKKNSEMVFLYGFQSIAIVLMLFCSFLTTGKLSLLLVTVVVLLAKVILAPLFFNKLILKHKLVFSVKKYVNTSFSLVIIAILIITAYSDKFTSLTNIIPANHASLSLAFSAMLLSLFLIVNSRGALSQIVAILSLENSIVAFAVFAELEQSAGLQIGIVFDIFVWMIVATMFVSMIQKHFGSIDVTSMKNLKD
ncbi:MAG: hypothetical protein NT068_02450 [Candidatus Nomurabacteria bacterium]|nr:hypothetical protein [Candidatus Nomurabacteria bacterium]